LCRPNDEGVVTVSAPSRTFTVAAAARRWRVSREVAEDFVATFVQQGLVELIEPDEYVVTQRGVEWSVAVESFRPELPEPVRGKA
jgi:hypothetical protein